YPEQPRQYDDRGGRDGQRALAPATPQSVDERHRADERNRLRADEKEQARASAKTERAAKVSLVAEHSALRPEKEGKGEREKHYLGQQHAAQIQRGRGRRPGDRGDEGKPDAEAQSRARESIGKRGDNG